MPSSDFGHAAGSGHPGTSHTLEAGRDSSTRPASPREGSIDLTDYIVAVLGPLLDGDEIDVEKTETDNGLMVVVYVGDADARFAIGRGGAHAQALRTLVAALASRKGVNFATLQVRGQRVPPTA